LGLGKLRKPLGDRILYEAVDHRDRVKLSLLLLSHSCGRRPAFISCFHRIRPAGLVGSADGKARDIAFGRLVLVDEVDPKRGDFGEPHLVGITTLLNAR